MNLRTFAQCVLLATLAMALLLLSPPGAESKTKGKEKEKGKNEQTEKETKGPTIQRVPNSAYESLQNHVSTISFYQTNYGIFGLNVLTGKAGGIWPRGS